MRLGGIEAGGTKFICAIGDEFGNIEKRVRINTSTPEETLTQVIDFFKCEKILAIGLGTFGPVDLNKKSDSYGSILETPKTSWKYFPLLEYLQKNLNLPIYITTDVNVACFGEVKLGNSQGLDNVIYMTIGTGIGAGAYVNHELLVTEGHSEMGHIILKPYDSDCNFFGVCPYHKYCLEGMASGPAIEQRFNGKAENLLDNETVWKREGYYLGQALYNISCILNPSRFILGGGVGCNSVVVKYTKEYFKEFNHNYLQNPHMKDLDSFIVNASLGTDAGIMGALRFAYEEMIKNENK